MEDNDIIFYVNKNDWREECKACLFKDFDETKMNKLDADYDIINNIFRQQDIKHWEINRVDIRFNKDSNTFHNIKWKDFDPRKMIIANDKNISTSINIYKIINEGKAPGLVESSNSNMKDRGSIFHKGKLDEGAVEDLLDKSLPQAENRAKERQDNLGHSFIKNDSNKVAVRRQ